MTQDTNTASDAADLPEALRSIQRFEVVDCIDDKHVPAVIPRPHGPWVRYEDHIAALAAGQATAAQAVVPAEWPTNEMIDAGRKAAASQGRLLGSGQSLWHVFRAMLAAAPAQPAAQQGVAYAALPDEVVRLAQVAIRECQYKGNDMPQDWMESAMRACRLIAASHGQAPASVLHLVNSAFAEIAMAFPKAFALHKVGIADKAVLEALAAPATAQADSVQEDAALWHWLAEYLVGPRTDLDDEIVASETVNDLRKLVKSAIKQGEKQ